MIALSVVYDDVVTSGVHYNIVLDEKNVVRNVGFKTGEELWH
jgi:hypothetical protein